MTYTAEPSARRLRYKIHYSRKNIMKKTTEKAYAKINLYLDVVGKRPDGYHDILSVMQTVDLFDTVTVRLSDVVNMTCTDESLSCGEDNLCIKAARAFFDALGESGGCNIHLEKHLPMQAGLGGGSSDGAAVLRALNRLYGSPFSRERLCDIGKRIGADVPFCVAGGTRLAEGIGEILSPYPEMPDCYIVISGGVGHVSTPEAYRLIDSTPPSSSGNIEKMTDSLKKGDLTGIASSLYNRFEDTLVECRTVKNILLSNNALGALMSGSGSAVFGIFYSEQEARRAVEALKDSSLTAFLCRPIGKFDL